MEKEILNKAINAIKESGRVVNDDNLSIVSSGIEKSEELEERMKRLISFIKIKNLCNREHKRYWNGRTTM